ILLDLNMPVYDGIEVCRRIRSNPQRRSVPIIMLTGHQDESTVVRAFESGADDYVTKPFRAKELRARVLSKVRGDRKEEPASRVSVGDISLDMDSMEVVVAGQMQRVTTLEFRILKHFVENAGRVVTRQALLSSAWKGVTVSDRTVDTHVVGIRRKLANSSMGIVTIYGAGYRLVRSPSA
ncbi:MAG: response regulator transcription factor, partial [Bdellovibrionales bacterium]|nr:response regulator transcription factor [Bdellovibrionales bacterium]